MSRIVGVIPARMGSSRFPGKPLARILGLPMIEHVYRRARLCALLDDTIVAACDDAIKSAAEHFGATVIMTSAQHERATDRTAEAVDGFEADIVVMIQGDEPLIAPSMIEEALTPLLKDAGVCCVNLAHEITSESDYVDRNTVKVVLDRNDDALYFSRAPIPATTFAVAPALKQVCVIPSRRTMLQRFAALPPTPLEQAEAIDMLRLIEHGYPIRFKVLRVMELMAYYTRYLSIFENARFKVGVMSSHSNPHAIAFNLAARKSRVPVVLITHGMPVTPVAKLFFDLALVHCEAARQTYMNEGCAMNHALIHGRKQNHRPMPTTLPTSLSAGIFLCKDVNEETFRQLTQLLLTNKRIIKILVRPHPKNLWRELNIFLNSLDDARIVTVGESSVWNDLDRVDLVFGGNSSVLIDAVVAGKPAVYVSNLDYGPDDMHQLVAAGLVCRLREELTDFSSLHPFYQRATWPETLRLFAAVDEDQQTVAEEFCRRMSELVTITKP